MNVNAADGVLNNDPDPDTATALLKAAVVPGSGPSKGTLNLQDNGSFTYTPNPDFSGVDSFRYWASDGQLNSNEATVEIVFSGTISGFVYADMNVNFRPDQQEGLAGVLIRLFGTDVNAGLSTETWTDQHGWYEFRGLPAGTYQVEQRQPECMVDGGDNTITVSVEPGQHVVGQNFRELGLKSKYIHIGLFFSSSRPVGSDRWCHLMAQTVQNAERDAGHDPESPPDTDQEIQLVGHELLVVGTVGDDQFEFYAANSPADQHEVRLNGERYPIAASSVDTIRFDGGLGNDQATLVAHTIHCRRILGTG